MVVAEESAVSVAKVTDKNNITKVLYINSYHRGYAWSDDIELGLKEEFEASGRAIDFSTEYLDTRRFSDTEHLDDIAESMKAKYKNYHMDLIVISDNAAFDFAVKHREQIFPDIPIVFCGYNNLRPEALSGLSNITGVNEEVDFSAGVDLALTVLPNTRNLVFILSTKDVTNQRITNDIEATMPVRYGNKYQLVFLKDMSLEQVTQRLKEMPKDSVVFLTGEISIKELGLASTPVESASRVAAASPIPTFGFWDFQMGVGVVGGRIINAKAQGLAAADLALRILNGEAVNKVEPVMTSPTEVVFDYQALQRYGISEEILPKNARLLNRHTIVLTKEERDWLKQNPHIKLSGLSNQPPFSMKASDGKPTGILADIFRHLNRAIGQEIVLEFADSSVIHSFSKTKGVYGNSAVFNTPRHQNEYLLSDRILTSPFYIYTTIKNQHTVKQPNDLKGKKVAIPRGHRAVAEYLDKIGGVEKIPTDSPFEQMQKVVSGEADATIGYMNYPYLINKYMMVDLVMAFVAQSDRGLHIGVNQKHPILLSILNKAIATMSEQQRQSIMSKWTEVSREKSPQIVLTKKEKAWLAKQPIITLGVDSHYPPYNYLDEQGNMEGLGIDYLKLLEQKLNLKFKLTAAPWSEVFPKAMAHDLDGIFNARIVEDRKEKLLFTEAYRKFSTFGLVIRKNSPNFEKLEELQGKKIAVKRNTFQTTYIKQKNLDIELIEFDSMDDALLELSKGNIYGVFDDLPVMQHLINKMLLADIKIGWAEYIKDEKSGWRIGVRNTAPELTSILSKAILKITEEESLQIERKWSLQQSLESLPTVGEELSEDKLKGRAEQSTIPPPPSWLIIIGVSAFILLAALMYRMSRTANIETQFGQKRFKNGLIVVLMLVVSIVSILAWWVLDYNKNQLLNNTQLELEVVLKTTHERLDIWVQQYKTYLNQLAHYPELISITERLLKVTPKPDALASSPVLAEARHFFSNKKDTFREAGFFIINPEHISIGSKRDSNLGTLNLITEHKPELLAKVFKGETLFIPPIQSDVTLGANSDDVARTTTMFFATPIKNQSGKVIAVLTQRLDPLSDFSTLLNFDQMAKTAETYAFSKQGQLLSESRFNEHLRKAGLIGANQHSSLSIEIRDPGGNLLTGYKPEIKKSQQPLTRMAASAIRGEKGIDMTGYRDYRGVQVFGAWLWDNKLDMGLTTEIDVDEALSSYYLLRWSIFGILAVTLLLSTGAILFTLFTGVRTSRNLSQSNKDLQVEIKERMRTERELKDREVLVGSIVDTVTDGIITISEDGIIRTFNKAAQAIFDVPADEIIGKSINELMPENMAVEHDNNIQGYIKSGLSKVIGKGRELVAKRSNGSLFPMEISVAEMWIGEQRMFTGVVRDITERKQAETELERHRERLEELVQERTKELKESEGRFRGLSESAFEGIFIHDAGLIIDLNQSALQMFGYDRDELIGQHSRLLLTPESSEIVSRNIAKSYEEPYEAQGVRKDGVEFPIEIHGKQIPYQGRQMRVTAVRDITERIKTDKELKQAKEAADAANQAKSVFLSNMSHELRTPLNAILGYAHILQNDHSIPVKQQDKIKIIQRSGENLLAHIADILDLAKIEAKNIELIPGTSNLKNFIDYVCNYFRNQAESKGVDLACEFHDGLCSNVKVDEKRLQQILLNLVGNAVKFTQKGKVVVRVEHDKSVETAAGQCYLRFTVEDTGMGIPEDSLENIFQPFVQLNRADQNFEGTGLGLNIAQQLITLMGSELKVKSEVGKGSCFWFELVLPLAEESEQTTETCIAMPTGYDGKQRKILVVDDIKDNRLLLRDLLESVGFKVYLISRGVDAIVSARDMLPDLILMDLLMPGMDGFTTLSTLRKITECKDIPVVAMSASVSEKTHALQAGFNHFLPKPTEPAILYTVLGNMLKLKWKYSTRELITENKKLAPPPVDELHKLRELVQLGKMKAIVEWAEVAQTNSPEYSDFAFHVKKLAENVNDEELLAFITLHDAPVKDS